MQNDEHEIRELVSNWLTATKAGDLETILSLMTDDVVFLLPGRPTMIGKSAFAEAARGQVTPQIDSTSQIQEIKIMGDWAFIWTELKIIITPPGSQPITRSGPTLSIFQKQNGRWLLARDANMLTLVPSS